MSPIASIGSGVETRIGRVGAPPVAATPAIASVSSEPARPRPAPLEKPDAVRAPRFDATTSDHAVRQVVQQIAGLAYGAHVSVVSTGTVVHATIDIAG